MVYIYIYIHIYIYEYYPAMREKEILPFETTWMGLEGTTLSKISQRKTNSV